VLPQEEWIEFREFADDGAARGMEIWLRNEQIAARQEGGSVFVARSLRHRAEWIVAQLPPTEEELNALATTAA
jgi:hypothetical protein